MKAGDKVTTNIGDVLVAELQENGKGCEGCFFGRLVFECLKNKAGVRSNCWNRKGANLIFKKATE